MHGPAISREELRTLTAIHDGQSLTVLLADWAIIAAIFAACAMLRNALVVCLLLPFIARQQHALAILIHDGVHRRLFSSPRINDLAVRWLLAAPLLISFDGYRRTHLRHHAHTMTAKDPDFQFVQAFPMTRYRLARQFIRDFTGISYCFLLVHYLRTSRMEFKTLAGFASSLLPPLVVNFVILASLWYSGNAWVYLACWLLPLFTLFPFLLHLRGICEHGGHEADPDPVKCTWTVLNPVETFFIAPHNINYHMEHHAFPAVPQYSLPQLHLMLMERDALPVDNIQRSYWCILKGLTSVK